VGRFAIITRTPAEGWRLVHDVIGIRGVFYTSENGKCFVASHASLAAQQLAAPEPNPALKALWGYPGVFTPFKRVFALTPNHYLDMAAGRPVRFYPHNPIPPSSPGQAADLCIEVGRAVIGGLLARGPVAASLSSGIDSRITLALSRPFSPAMRYFTYVSNANTLPDVGIAKILASDLKLKHDLLLPDADTLDASYLVLMQQLRRNSNRDSDAGLIPRYLHTYGQWTYTHLRSNMYEIARAAFQAKHASRFSIADPASMAAYYKHWNVYKTGDDGFVLSACEDFFEQTRLNEAAKYIDRFDLYFWEHRMPQWQSSVMANSDCVWETVIPLSSRQVLECFVGIPVAQRIGNQVYHAILSKAHPELADYPTNPGTWGTYRELTERARKRGRELWAEAGSEPEREYAFQQQALRDMAEELVASLPLSRTPSP
jgi:hypothetical protein